MRIVVLDDLEGAAAAATDWARLPAGDDVRILRRHLADRAELVAALDGADVVVCMRERTPFPRDLLERLPSLRLLVTTGPRNAALDLAACADLGITVSGTRPGGSPVVELAWALILATARDLPARARSMRDGAWAPTAGRSLAGRRLGLLGLGRTGTRMARIAAAFDMDVVAWSQNLTVDAATERGARLVTRDELFAGSDVVSIHLLLSDRTRGLVGAAQLRAMRADAWLVNTSRGAVCDEAALVQALTEGWIAGVALDVYATEPLPADHPLRRLPNAVLTPHVGYVTWETLRTWFDDVVEDIDAFRSGSPVRVLAAPTG